MPIDHILSLLIAEKDKLSRAIEALQGPLKRRGRPPKWMSDSRGEPAAVTEPRKKRVVSHAARARMAAAQRKRWAAKKAEAKSQPKTGRKKTAKAE